MAFTLGTAAQATGTAKSTILRAIRAGRISATRDDIGQYVIDPAELARTFPLLAIPGAPPPQPRGEHDAMTDVLVAELRATIADLRQDRDRWHDAHARSQEALATMQRQLGSPVKSPDTPLETPIAMPMEQAAPPNEVAAMPVAPVIEQPAPPKKRWWRRA